MTRKSYAELTIEELAAYVAAHPDYNHNLKWKEFAIWKKANFVGGITAETQLTHRYNDTVLAIRSML